MNVPGMTNRIALPLALALATVAVFAVWICGVTAQDDLTAPPGIEGPRLEGPVANNAHLPGEVTWAEQPGPQIPLFLPAPGGAERRILAALNKETKVEFLETPLVDVAQFVARQSGIPIIIDNRSLDDSGIPTDEPVNVTLAGVSLRSALKIILDDIGLTWVIEDEVLKITTKEAAEAKEFTRVYPVGDLVSPDESSWDELTEAIQTGVLKGRWQSVDGTGGTVSTVRSASALVVRQTRGAHDQILDLLVSLREARHLAPPEADLFGDEAILDGSELEPAIIPPAEFGAGAEASVTDDETHVITLAAGKGKPTQVTFDGTTEDIAKAVARIAKLKRLRNSSVLIRADAETEHKDVVTLLDALQKIGAVKISIAVTDRGPEEGARPGVVAPPEVK